MQQKEGEVHPLTFGEVKKDKEKHKIKQNKGKESTYSKAKKVVGGVHLLTFSIGEERTKN